MRPLPPDVPVHRGRVGATRVGAACSEYPDGTTFRPYVYQGTGVDQFEPPPPPPKPKRTRKRQPKAKPVKPTASWDGVYYPAQPRRPEPEPEPEPKPEPAPPEPEPSFQKPKRHPAPGWHPTTGDAIEALLRELGTDET